MADAVQQLVGMPNLPLTTALKGTTAKIGTEPIGPGQLEPALQELRGAETAAQERMLTAGAAEAKAQREEEAKKLDITARTAREQKAAIEALPEQEIAKQARQEAEAMKFSPTRDNAQDLAGLFSLIGVIGMVVGKGNAQAAMSAMDGMAKGYQQGRADLYKQQSTEFDKNFKAMQMKLQQAEKDLEKAIQLKKYDFQAGEAEAMAALARSESPLLKATYEKQGAIKALELLKDTRKDLTDAVNKYNDLSEKAYRRTFDKMKFDAEQRRHREKLEADERRHRETLASRERIASLKQLEGPKSAINERYAQNVFRSANEVNRSLELLERIGLQTGTGVLGQVVGKGTVPSEIQRQLGQYVTDEQQKNYNAAMSGLGLELAMVLSGGYKPDVSLQNKIETYLSVGPNDTQGNAAFKFADVVAKLKAALEVQKPFNEEQRATKEKLSKKLDQYATPEEIYDRMYGAPTQPAVDVRRGGGSAATPRATLNDRAIVVRDGKWVFEDTGEEAK